MMKPAFTSLAKPSSCRPQGLCTCCLGKGEGQEGKGQRVEPRTLRDGRRFEWPSSPWMLQFVFYSNLWTFPGGSDGKESACDVGDLGSTSGSGRSPGEENGYPLQVSCLGNPMDRGAWQATVHRSQRVQYDWVIDTMDTWRCLLRTFHLKETVTEQKLEMSGLKCREHTAV